jgi:CPA2 family monovalent cation:H+ antiporter-2
MLLAGSTPPYFAEAAVVMVAGAVIAYAAARAGLVPIVGFLLAGVVIGPSALGLVHDREMVDAAAEIGVVLLLFTIGIEFSFERLARIRRLILGGGALQVGLATGVTAAVLLAFGVDARAAVFTGFLVALSSTAIVLKLLGDRGESASGHGQVALGLLIFQDLAIIPMVLLVPALGGQGGSAGEVAWALARAVILIAAVLLFARRLMPKLLEVVARTCSPEVFLLTVVAICFGTAWLTSLAGVSLSLGAFLAGLLVSESHFSEHALGEILPLQILFSATFFVSVGMLLDLRFLVTHLPLVAAAVAGVVLIKLLTTGFAARALGYATPVSAAGALVLAQIGEFSFVLERTGREAGLSFAGLGVRGSQTFIAASVVLMVSTPLLAALGSRVGGRLERRAGAAAASHARVDESAEHLPPLENHVLVAGYGDAARRLTRVLSAARIPFAVATLSPQGADEAEGEGFPVLRGDYTRQRTLQLVGAERAKLMVVADDDPATAYRAVAVGRTLSPTLRILVRTRYAAEVDKITGAGADRVVAEELEGIVRLFAEVLEDYGVAADEAAGYTEAVRRGGYTVLRAPEAPDFPACTLGEGCLDTRAVTVRPGAPVAGRVVGGLGLEAAYGVSLRAVRVDGRWDESPSPDLVVEPGTELRLAGTAEAFVRAAEAFRAPGGDERADEPPPATPAAGVSTEQVVTLKPSGAVCAHVAEARPVHPSAAGCEECLRAGDDWVHLRICMTCGHVGCCDSSKNRHARAHFHGTRHPVMRSLEPGETWGWCYEDGITL